MADIPNVNLDSRSDTVMAAPDTMVKVREAFGVDTDMEVPAFSEADSSGLSMRSSSTEGVPDHMPVSSEGGQTTMTCSTGAAKAARRAASALGSGRPSRSLR